ncbi:MAG TPA: hypothetical protein DDZ88_00110, partial [Verrucomicrobiales bacterium]|nr:hypothetical protein [Verrucomicrobiales bacterium]
MIILCILSVLVGIGLLVYVRKMHKGITRLMERKILQLQDEVESNRALHLVVSIGKCGGSTLAASVRKAFDPRPVYHLHAISQKGMELCAEMWLKPEIINREAAMDHLRGALKARLAIEERRARYGKPAGYYICGVREPVALAVSGYFQLFDASRTLESFSFEKACHDILNGPVLNSTDLYVGGLAAWFDREIRDVIGVDIWRFAVLSG